MIDVVLPRLEDRPLAGGIGTFLNLASYRALRGQGHLLSRFDAVYIDGSALVLLLRAFGFSVERRSMDLTSFAPVVLGIARDEGRKVILVGGHKSETERACLRLARKFGPLQIEGYPGYFAEPTERRDLVDRLAVERDSIVICGMGAVRQESFLVDLVEAGWQGQAYTCGGFISQTASGNSVEYYPSWVEHSPLRAVYRFLREPHTRKRYLIDYPVSMLVILADLASALREARRARA